MAKVVMFEPGMKRMGNMSEKAAHSAAIQIAREIRENVGVDTGALRESVRPRKLRRSSRVYVGTDHWYYHEYGVEPHIIRTSTKKVLADNGVKIYGKTV